MLPYSRESFRRPIFRVVARQKYNASAEPMKSVYINILADETQPRQVLIPLVGTNSNITYRWQKTVRLIQPGHDLTVVIDTY